MLNPDLPITKNSEDILNRSTFANSLAKTLLQYSFSSSLTIGLYGEWGSGKTFFLRQFQILCNYYANKIKNIEKIETSGQ